VYLVVGTYLITGTEQFLKLYLAVSADTSHRQWMTMKEEYCLEIREDSGRQKQMTSSWKVKKTNR
jgi:hypothetical protein